MRFAAAVRRILEMVGVDPLTGALTGLNRPSGMLRATDNAYCDLIPAGRAAAQAMRCGPRCKCSDPHRRPEMSLGTPGRWAGVMVRV